MENHAHRGRRRRWGRRVASLCRHHADTATPAHRCASTIVSRNGFSTSVGTPVSLALYRSQYHGSGLHAVLRVRVALSDPDLWVDRRGGGTGGGAFCKACSVCLGRCSAVAASDRAVRTGRGFLTAPSIVFLIAGAATLGALFAPVRMDVGGPLCAEPICLCLPAPCEFRHVSPRRRSWKSSTCL